MVQKVEHNVQKHGSIFKTTVIICGEKQLARKASPLKNGLETAGFSEEAIREIERWYCSSPKNGRAARRGTTR